MRTNVAFEDSAALDVVDMIVLVIFAVECGIKIVACGLKPWEYCTGHDAGWNNFDLIIVVLCMPGVIPGVSDTAPASFTSLLRQSKPAAAVCHV